RLQSLNEAQALVQRLKKPWEKAYQMTWVEPILLFTVKASSEMGLFAALETRPKTPDELAKTTGTDARLIGRFCRILAVNDIIGATDENAYFETELSRAFADPDGLVNGIHHSFDLILPVITKAPAYLREKHYDSPSDGAHPPWRTFMDSPDLWTWFREHPDAHAHFNSFFAILRAGMPPWTSMFPPTKLLKDFDASTMLSVDVGGGKGGDARHLAAAVSSSHPQARIVVQDQPEVIAAARESKDLPSQIELMPYNFFDEQPVKGARCYFLHSICHDWADYEAHQILMRVKEACTPGYSKVLLLETVLPEKVQDTNPRAAAMDINMMLLFGALERTERQWRDLLEGAGLKFVRRWEVEGNAQCLIEAS
ncbi:hypothetical protein BAUCODRAFT_57291, partial [Baudoinia panamericana UAMH 10762]